MSVFPSFGPDAETNGVWALDVVRDAHMELENAKHLKCKNVFCENQFC